MKTLNGVNWHVICTIIGRIRVDARHLVDAYSQGDITDFRKSRSGLAI